MPQQGCVSVSFPAQSVPPCWAATFVLFLSWVPLPQFTEQVSHVPHVCQVQSTMDPKKHCSTPSYICMKLEFTWANVIIAGLCFSIISYTISATMLSSNLCPVPLLSATATAYRAYFPCAPFIPSTIHYGHQKYYSMPALPCMIEIWIYPGKENHCRVVFLFHFLRNQRHHVEQQP